MNIVMLAGHACVRVQKEALCLLAKGHKVHLISSETPTFVESYATHSRCFTVDQFVDAIRVYSKIADIFHAHNEPSWFVTLVKECSDVPVILDVHDSFLTRLKQEEEDKRIEEGKRRIRIQTEERNNFQLANGFVFPSNAFAKSLTGEFRLNQPHLILPPYLPESLYCYNTKEWFGGLVYEGRVDLQKETEANHKLNGFKYCVYEDLARQCSEVGIDFHLQVVRKDKEFLDAYKDIAFVHEPANWMQLLPRLSRHDWGLVGNVYPSEEWDVAMPNKLFEYVAASVPIVAINARESADLITKYGIGIEVQSIKELAERWSEHRECRKNLIRVRKEFAMDNHIHKLEELYATVLAAN